MGVLAFAQYLVYRDQQKKFNLGTEKRKKKEKLAKLAECMRTGRQVLYTPGSRGSQADWVKWASDIDDWMSNTFVIIQTEFGDLAVEKFVNDAGMKDTSYPGVPHEFQYRLQVLNRRLQNLDAIAQRIDAYL